MARKRGDSNLVRTCLRTESMAELHQKLTKDSQKMLNTGRLHRGGHLLEGGVFLETYGICEYTTWNRGQRKFAVDVSRTEGKGYISTANFQRVESSMIGCIHNLTNIYYSVWEGGLHKWFQFLVLHFEFWIDVASVIVCCCCYLTEFEYAFATKASLKYLCSQ